jgi:F-type H+-transporting ATPase subunit gamma
MSGATDELRRKIGGARDIDAVVRSMKALAASSIGQYERAVEALEDYYRTVELGLTACLKHAPASANTNLGPNGRIGAVIFGSDLGLVGRFNDVLMDFIVHALDATPGDTARIWAVGERIHALALQAGLAAPTLLSVPTSVNGIARLVGQILIDVQKACERGTVREIHLFYNSRKASGVYEPTGRRLLPLDRVWQTRIAGLPWPTKNVAQVIDGGEAALESFIQEYLFIVLYQACAQSLASENASRLTAMQRAEKNIEEILDKLQRSFHRIRQESIDEELFDVVAGADSRQLNRQLPLP